MNWRTDPAPGSTLASILFVVALAIVFGLVMLGWGSTDCQPNYPCSTTERTLQP